MNKEGINASFCLFPERSKTGDHRQYTHFLSPMLKMSEISLIRAPIFFSILTYSMEKPAKSSFSVPVENKPYNGPVCQNTVDLHISQSPLKALKSR
jgi:hypothetical protein